MSDDIVVALIGLATPISSIIVAIINSKRDVSARQQARDAPSGGDDAPQAFTIVSTGTLWARFWLSFVAAMIFGAIGNIYQVGHDTALAYIGGAVGWIWIYYTVRLIARGVQRALA